MRKSLLLLFLLLSATSGYAQITAFNFQGRLNDSGVPANGRYDLQFKLFDSPQGGAPVAMAERPDTMVVNGVFSTILDFGSTVFGQSNKFIEIGLRSSGSANAYVVLGTRQQVLTVPYSITSYQSIQSSFSSRADVATSADNSDRLGGILPSGYAKMNFDNTGDLRVLGNTKQPENSNGLPKAMLAVTAGRAIARCYNGVSNTTAANCGFLVDSPAFIVTFPFRVSNRFWMAVPDATGSPSLGVRVANIEPLGDFQLVVYTYSDGTPTLMPFHLFVF